MLERQITYENPFTNEEVTETHYFHISKADLVEMEMEEHKDEYVKDGQTYTGMQAKLQRIVDAEDGKAIFAEFKEIIRRSYGKKVGDRFLKSPEIWSEFASTEAYSQLLFEICSDAEAASAFMNGIVPGDLEKIMAEVSQEAGTTPAAAPTPAPAATEEVGSGVSDDSAGPRLLTRSELEEMDANDLASGLASGRYKLS